MPDIGVLNLQIHDNSEKAIDGLDRLAGALGRIRDAVKDTKLTQVANGLKRIANVVEKEISESAISKIGMLADELSKLKGLGNLNIKINGGTSVQSMREAVEAARESMSEINTGFDEFKRRSESASGGVDAFNQSMRDTEALMQNNSWVYGVERFRELFEEFNRIRMAMSLPAGNTSGLSTEVEKGWTSWKDGAIEVEGTVTDAMDGITARLGEPIKYLTDTASQLGSINDYLGNANSLVEEFAKNTSSFSSGENAIIPYVGGRTELEDALDRIRQKTELDTEAFYKMSEAAQEAARIRAQQEAAFYAAKDPLGLDKTNKMADNLTQLDLLKAQLRDAEAAYNKFVDELGAGATKTIKAGLKVQDLRDKIWSYENALREAREEMEKFSEAVEGGGDGSSIGAALSKMKDGIQKLFAPLTGLIGRFKQIVKYRAIRAVLRHITEGFSEGVQNVYQYSKLVGTDLAPAMDSAATAIQQFKNSIGAAVAPLIQAFIPTLKQVINVVIEGVNWLNQFFALLNGQGSWTRALPEAAEAYDSTAKSAKNASKATKDLLASWDELNIIQSKDNGSAGTIGGHTADEYKNMFEEVNKFDESVKDAIEFINDNLGGLPGLLKKAGAIILGWKFSKAFTGIIGTIGALLAAGEVLTISWKLTEFFDKKYLEDGDDGWLVKDALTNLVGSTLAGGIVTTVLGGGTGLITAGIELAVSGGISYGIALANEDNDRAEALKDLGVIKGVIGDILIGAGFGIVAGPAGAIFGATAGVLMFTISSLVSVVVKQYETAQNIAKKAFAETGEGGIKVDDIFKALQDEYNKASSNYTIVVNAFAGAKQLKLDLANAFSTVRSLTATVRSDGKLTQAEADEFKKAWTTVFDAFEGLTSTSFETIFKGLNESLQSENETLREEAKKLRVTTLSIYENISEAEAEYRIEQQNLLDKITKGTATADEIDRYYRNLELMAKVTKTSMTDFNEAIKEGKNIDFGDKDSAVGNAVQFINNSAAAAQEATAEIDAGYDELIKSLEEARRATEFAYLYGDGKMSKEEYDAAMETFDQLAENFNKAADDSRTKVKTTAEDAYRKVIEQAIAGIANMENLLDENGKFNVMDIAAYMGDVITPILSAARDAGYDFGEEFGKMFGIGISKKEWFDKGWSKVLADYIRKEVLKIDIEPEEAKPEVEVEPQVTVLPYRLRDQIDEAIWDAAENGSLSTKTLQDLAEEYGVDLQTILDNIDFKYQLDDTTEKIRELVEVLNKENGLELKFPDLNGQNVSEETEKVAKTYENMASRIRAAFSSIDGLGFTLNLDGTNGSISVNFPVNMMATGGFPRSGDLVMANENGNIEMMGSMGGKPVVANNQQIVEGITHGVSSANEDVVTELRGLGAMMRQLIANGLVARAVPSSSWGQHNAQSAEAYDRVRG